MITSLASYGSAVISTRFLFSGHYVLPFCQSCGRLTDMHKVSFGFGAVVHWVTLIVKQIDGVSRAKLPACQVRV